MADMVLNGDLDVAGAKDAAQTIADWLSELGETTATLEVTTPDPGQIALQLLFATARTLESRTNVRLGPNAEALMSKAQV